MTPSRALLVALIATLVFSTAPASIRTVQLDSVTLGICRLLLASLGMTALLAWRWSQTRICLKAWNWRTTRSLLLIGLAFGIHWLLFFLSIKIGSAAIGTVGFSTYGLHLIVLGWLLGRSQVTGIDLTGLLIACLGTWLLIPEFSLTNEDTVGLAIGVLSGLAAALLPLLHQHYADVDGNLRAWGQFTLALPVFLCCLPLSPWEYRPTDWLLILYLGVGIALVGHGLWIHAITSLPTTTISILSYLYLPLSLVFGYFAIGERLTGRELVGVALVLIANALVIISQKCRGTLD